MNRTLRLAFGILVVSLALTWAAFAQEADQQAGPAVDVSVAEVLADFDVVWETISEGYVDPGFGGVDWESLKDEYRSKVEEAEDALSAYEAIDELTEKLGNEYTFVVPPWLRPEQASEPEEDSSGIELEYAGVGILLQQMTNGDVWVLQVFSETPAEAAGVLVGDVISGVEDWRVEGENPVSEISKRVRGPVGTDITLTVRDPEGGERNVTIERARIDLRPSVEYRVVEGSIGYLRIPALSEELVDEASRALPQLLSARSLILDLRNVSGGNLEAMVKVAQWFIGAAQMGGFVSRDGAAGLPFREDAVAAFQRPMTVLTNTRTYGIGEILAVVLNDYKRARIVGNPTQGGFQIGQFVDLPSGALLQMTIGLYVTPKGELLPLGGLTPNDTVELPDLATVRSGRDVYIEKAIEVLRTNPRL